MSTTYRDIGLQSQVAQQQKASVMTQPDPADPLRDAYGDAPLVQSCTPSGILRTRIQDISTALEGQLVRLATQPLFPAMHRHSGLALAGLASKTRRWPRCMFGVAWSL